MTPDAQARARVGIFGGSGLYTLLEHARDVEVSTPWGSVLVSVGRVDGHSVAFVPRHGRQHELPPHRVAYRANVAAMARLGVQELLAPFAAGSLQAGIAPGDLVVVDQFVDRTSGRAETFHDDFADGPQHVSLADPYDVSLGRLVTEAGRAEGFTVHDGGTVVVINGPRFSTRAESAWYQSAGWHLVNMTQFPEVALAREANLRYAGIALVTDYDVGVAGVPELEPVTQEAVFGRFEENVERLRALLLRVVRTLGPG